MQDEPDSRAAAEDRDAAFLSLQPRLRGLAYRMLGSVADSEDMVQETWLRWANAGFPEALHPKAYFSSVTTRLCLDRLKRASKDRERYVGVWLPDPLVARLADQGRDELGFESMDVPYGLMMVLERLSPLERAAYLLHDLFDVSFEEIAETLERTPSACRQLASRGRKSIRERKEGRQPEASEIQRLVGAFASARASGDPAALREVLAEDVRFYSDGGGKVLAALKPIIGVDKVIRLLLGLAKRNQLDPDAPFELRQVNGGWGFVHEDPEVGPQPFAFEVDGAGKISGIFTVRNPEKLRHLGRVL